MGKVFQRLFKSNAAVAQEQQLCVDPDERLYVIGDIHGRNDLLLAMLSKVVDDAQAIDDERKARFIFLGDYVDRGDQSKDVLDTLCAVKDAGDARFDFLMGNHEAAMLAFLDDPIRGADWLSWGGRQTLSSYGISPVPRDPSSTDLRKACAALREKSASHNDFLRSLERYAVSGDVICTHAGLDPERALEDQSDADLLWAQSPSALDGRLLVHGHFASYEPVREPGRICVDTGAYYSGRLTAVCLDTDVRFIHVDVMDIMP